MDYSSITELDLSNQGLTELPELSAYTNLQKLNCSYNKITYLNNLSGNLTYLNCIFNKITHLDNLPGNLIFLDCSYNQITHLDNLPLSLRYLYCLNNQITHLDYLPLSLTQLFCTNNKITHLDNLPDNLTYLDCWNNKITRLDNLPGNLTILYCCYNKITHLDNLPLSLKYLECSNNPLVYDFVPTLENIRLNNYVGNSSLKLDAIKLKCDVDNLASKIASYRDESLRDYKQYVIAANNSNLVDNAYVENIFNNILPYSVAALVVVGIFKLFPWK